MEGWSSGSNTCLGNWHKDLTASSSPSPTEAGGGGEGRGGGQRAEVERAIWEDKTLRNPPENTLPRLGGKPHRDACSSPDVS